MMLLVNFNRKFTVWRANQFGAPKVASLTDLEFPRGSALHYLSDPKVSELGPPKELPIFAGLQYPAQIQHVATLPEHGVIGRPRRVLGGIERDLRAYTRMTREKLRPMHSDKLIKSNDKILQVVNYSPIRRVMIYPQTLMAWYERWYNVAQAVIQGMGKNANDMSRQNYFMFGMPSRLPAVAKLRMAETKRDKARLAEMRDESSLFFLELWTWLGDNRDSSIFSQLTNTQLKRINIVITFNEKFICLNLGELNYWRKGSGTGGKIIPRDMQLRLYKSMKRLALADLEDPADVFEKNDQFGDDEVNVTDELKDMSDAAVMLDRSDADDESGNDLSDEEDIAKFDLTDVVEDEDFEIVQSPDEVSEIVKLETNITIENGIETACQRFVDAGTISTKDYQKVLAKAETYKSIPNPFGSGTIDDMLVIKPEELNVDEEVLFENDGTILDEGMLKTTSRQMTKKYITEVLPKDITAAVMSVQRAGVVVEDYKVDEVIDAANRLQVHTLRLTPVKGRTVTIRFNTPLLDEEGYWTANDVKYTMRRQRVDMPIRKTHYDTVALTTFYGKNFIRRSEKVAYNYPTWLGNQITAASRMNDDSSITKVSYSNVFDPSLNLPRDYTGIARRISSFTAGGVNYNFDIKRADEIFGEGVVSELKEQELTPIGKDRKSVYAMDQYSVVYRRDDKGIEEIDRLANILGFPSEKAPREYSELSLMRQSIPLAIIFSYYMGLQNALREYNVIYRIAEAGERIPADEGDLLIAFSDAKLVLTFDTKEQELLFNGFKPYLKIMKDFTIADFDKKDVYLNLIQKDGLSIRYLNELDLMETSFVDDISARILTKMGEPTNFRGLLRRSNEMLTTDQHPKETDMSQMHIYGSHRIAGAIYTGLTRGIRDLRNRPGTDKRLDIPNSEIWSSIAQDPAVSLASDSNVIQSIREADSITFSGKGGRSKQSMVKRTREFTESDLGITSGDTVDSGDVAINAYSVANPIYASLDGEMLPTQKSELGVMQLVSTAVALAPGTLYDDDKRANFIGIQHGSGAAAAGYEAPCYRTGFEKIVAHRTSSTHANTADESGVVKEVTDHGIVVEYNTKPKTERAYTLGKFFGRHEGGVYPHVKVTSMKKGQKFQKGAVLAYNENFFEPDIFSPEQVNWKLGTYANTILIESTDTFEDSSAISPWLAEQLKSQTTKIKHITVRFDQYIHDMLKVGTEVDYDTKLCIIEDSLTAGNTTFSDDSYETLRKISAQAPKAGFKGKIDKIEVFYNGDPEDMSPAIAEIVKRGDKQRKLEAKHSPIKIADNGKIDSTLRIDGNPVELDTVVIRVYITGDVIAIGGDKAVFANQMKTTFRRVMTGRNETADGQRIDAIFGKVSVDARIVLSVYRIGTTVKLCQMLSDKAQEMARLG